MCTIITRYVCAAFKKKSAKMGKIDLGMAAAGAGAGAAFGPIGAGVGGVLGLAGGLFGKNKNKEQLEQQRELQALELAGNKELMGLSFEQQKQMYDYQMEASSEKNQVKRLKEAGLNPALLYGQGGAGVSAVSGGSGGTGAVTGGQAANAAAMQGAETQQMMMGLQMAKLGAEIKVLEADARQKEAGAVKTEGVDTQVGLATLNKLITETTNEEVKTSINRIQRDVEMFSAADRVGTIEVGLKQAEETLERMERENKIGSETVNAAINEIRNKAELSSIEVAFKEEQVNYTKEQIEAVKNGIMQKWAEIKNTDEANRIRAIEAEIKINMPGIGGVVGGVAKQVVNGLMKMGGGKDYEKTIRK